jgi:anthranilate synthase component I
MTMGKNKNSIIAPGYVQLDTSIDFFELFQKIEREFDTCFYLESLGGNAKDSRYSIIGFAPSTVISPSAPYSLPHIQNPFFALRNFIPDKYTSARKFSGGLVGYLSYDAMLLFEPSLSITPHKKFPLFLFGLYEDGLLYDKTTGVLSYFYHKENRAGIIKRILQKKLPMSGASAASVLKIKRGEDTMSAKQHRKAVEEVIEEIRMGNTFQCQIGFKRTFQVKGNTVQLYRRLRSINPSPHMYYLKFKHRIIIGASPELLLNTNEGIMETYPLAGTVKRGKNNAEDQGLARRLLSDPKELAEHCMLVDLHRNDLGKVARIGSVRVSRLMEVKRFSHVQHISSEVMGLISPAEDSFSALAATFPAGTLSGTPKIETMKIIERIENNPRGPYGGAIGYFGFDGNCKMAIPIRSMFIADGEAYTQASGGIVWDSTAQGEYREIQNKLAGMQQAVEPFIK